MYFAIEWLLFEGLDFFNGDTASDTVLQVQDISQKSTRPKCPHVHRLDNGSNSTIQLTYISTNNMKIRVGPLLFGLFDFFYLMRGWDYTPKFSPIWKIVKQQPLDRI